MSEFCVVRRCWPSPFIRCRQPLIILSPRIYDGSKTVTLTGKVTKIEWTNPTAFFYIDVKDEKTGATANWAAEMNSPNI
jgi:hypothetical protein